MNGYYNFSNKFCELQSSTRMRAKMITWTLKKRYEVYKSRPFCEWICLMVVWLFILSEKWEVYKVLRMVQYFIHLENVEKIQVCLTCNESLQVNSHFETDYGKKLKISSSYSPKPFKSTHNLMNTCDAYFFHLVWIYKIKGALGANSQENTTSIRNLWVNE